MRFAFLQQLESVHGCVRLQDSGRMTVARNAIALVCLIAHVPGPLIAYMRAYASLGLAILPGRESRCVYTSMCEKRLEQSIHVSGVVQVLTTNLP